LKELVVLSSLFPLKHFPLFCIFILLIQVYSKKQKNTTALVIFSPPFSQKAGLKTSKKEVLFYIDKMNTVH